MNVRHVLSNALLFSLLFAISGVSYGQCLHSAGETPDQLQRRRTAIAAMRLINTTEVNYFRQANHYGGLQELATSSIWNSLINGRDAPKLSTVPGTDLIPGFDFHLTADATTWSMSLKDKTDSCGFTVFSNEMGVIYTGYPMDYQVTPSKP